MRIEDSVWHVTGGYGMLGTDLLQVLRDRGASVLVSDQDTLDITDPASVHEGLRDASVVVNCAAFTAVDLAEEREAEALIVNGKGAGVLAQACRDRGSRLIHISTDYVFAGDASVPYAEESERNPQNAYGRTKAAGEREVEAAGGDSLIVRTSWLYGEHGACFPKTIARVAREKGELRVVDDQIGQPTWTMDLADLLVRLIEVDAPCGIYHGTSSGQTSWYDFAREVVAAAGVDATVLPCDSSAYPRPARRPAYSVLSHAALTRIGVDPIGDWLLRWREAAPVVLKGLGGFSSGGRVGA